MFELATLPNQELAQLICDSLKQQGIPADARWQGDGWHLWVPGEQLADAQEWLNHWRQHPDQLNQSAWQSSRASQHKNNVRLTQGFRRFGALTKIVTAICVLVYLSRYMVGGELYAALLYPEQLIGLTQAPWRLFTPALLHFSLLHITFNLIWWLDLGGQIERKQSWQRLLLLTLLIAVISNTAQFLITGPLFGGLSGVVYGLLGYVWVQGKLRPASGLSVQNGVLILMLVWLVLCWTGLLGNVANMAHLAGLITGTLFGVGAAWFDKQSSRQVNESAP